MQAAGPARAVLAPLRVCEQARAADAPVAPFVALVALCARVHGALCQQWAAPRDVRLSVTVVVQAPLDRLAHPAPRGRSSTAVSNRGGREQHAGKGRRTSNMDPSCACASVSTQKSPSHAVPPPPRPSASSSSRSGADDARLSIFWTRKGP